MQRLIPVAGLLALAGCGPSAPRDKDVLAQGAKLVKPLPGLYRSSTRLTAFELPGADPETADTMRDKFSRILPQTSDFCLTPQAAAHGFEDMLRHTQQGDCTFERFDADASRLSARMHCRSGQVASEVTVEGTGARDRSHVSIEIAQLGSKIPGGSETISLEVDNRRVGDCPSGNPTG